MIWGVLICLWAVRVAGKRAWGMESCSITRCRIYAIGRGLVFSEGWVGRSFVMEFFCAGLGPGLDMGMGDKGSGNLTLR